VASLLLSVSQLDESAERAIARVQHGSPIVLDPGVGEKLRLRPRADHQPRLDATLGEQARQDERAGQASRVSRNVCQQTCDRAAEPVSLCQRVPARWPSCRRLGAQARNNCRYGRTTQCAARLPIRGEYLDAEAYASLRVQPLRAHDQGRRSDRRRCSAPCAPASAHPQPGVSFLTFAFFGFFAQVW
jgi:hypothetical protein